MAFFMAGLREEKGDGAHATAFVEAANAPTKVAFKPTSPTTPALDAGSELSPRPEKAAASYAPSVDRADGAKTVAQTHGSSEAGAANGTAATDAAVAFTGEPAATARYEEAATKTPPKAATGPTA